MNKILAIMKREYLNKVKKKSFIIMTILMPLLMIVFMGMPIVMSMVKVGIVKIGILDESSLFDNVFEDTKNMELHYIQGDLEYWKVNFKDSFDALLYIPDFSIQYPSGFRLYTMKQVGLSNFRTLENKLKYIVEEKRFINAGIDKDLVDRLRVNIDIESIDVSGGEEKASNIGISMALGQIMSFGMYFLIFTYGSMIMRAVIEEKKNRIVEILVSSVRPFQLLLGKILGIACVALTQLVIWIILISIIMSFFMMIALPKVVDIEESIAEIEQQISMPNKMVDIAEFINEPGAINFKFIAFVFIIYFIFGYLFYTTLFAAVGSVSDDENNQQFMLPLTLPIILSIFIIINVADNPHSSLAFWSSLIPFCSPIVMLARLPFSVPIWQLYISVFILIFSFIIATWASGKIYRIGIFMYGKKLTWKDLWKFIVNS